MYLSHGHSVPTLKMKKLSGSSRHGTHLRVGEGLGFAAVVVGLTALLHLGRRRMHLHRCLAIAAPPVEPPLPGARVRTLGRCNDSAPVSLTHFIPVALAIYKSEGSQELCAPEPSAVRHWSCSRAPPAGHPHHQPTLSVPPSRCPAAPSLRRKTNRSSHATTVPPWRLPRCCSPLHCAAPDSPVPRASLPAAARPSAGCLPRHSQPRLCEITHTTFLNF